MGGAARHGRWTPKRRVLAVATMGGAEIDFREAGLGPGVTDLTVVAFMGGVEVTVPPEAAVEVTGFPFMGAVEQTGRASQAPGPDHPLIRVKAFACMGGIEVRVLARGERMRDFKREQMELRRPGRG